MPWKKHCSIVPYYMPPYPRTDTKPSIQVRFQEVKEDFWGDEGNVAKRACFLRRIEEWPKGKNDPQINDEGYFWDCYGKQFSSVEEALEALNNASPPRGWSGC